MKSNMHGMEWKTDLRVWKWLLRRTGNGEGGIVVTVSGVEVEDDVVWGREVEGAIC